jgi:hypothetical protein
MFKPLIFSIALIAALSACSKKDDAASNNVRTTPANAVSSSEDPARNGANAPAPGPEGSEAQSERTAKEAAISTEAEAKKHKKQTANAAHGSAKGTRSVIRRRWGEFQAMMDRCDRATGAAREQCLAGAKDTYRSANFKCDALPAREGRNCLQFAERWNNAAEEASTAAVKHDKEPMMTAPSPGDPRPAERNRDSTKQQQDAVGTLPEPTKPN